MAKISLIAKLPCAEGKNDDFEAALAAMIEASNEGAGLEIGAAHMANDSNDYYFFELYADGDALKIHGKGDAMKTAMAAIGPFMAGKPEITMMTPVVAKGIEL